MDFPKIYSILVLSFIAISCSETKRDTTTHHQTISAQPVTDDSTITEKPEKEATTPTKSSPDTVDFATVFSNFQLAILNQDSVAFQKFIDLERGLYIIEVPGAVPHFTQIKHINIFKRHFQQKPFFSIREKLQPCSLQTGLPQFSCDPEKYGTKSGYSKEGCFVGLADNFRKSKMWQYAGLGKAQTQQIEATLPLLSKTVIHTASSYKFHFGFVNGRWHVYFIDLMEPCSA